MILFNMFIYFNDIVDGDNKLTKAVFEYNPDQISGYYPNKI